MLIFDYPSKKVLRTQVGRTLHYHETSMFGPEYKSTGLLIGSNRPHITGHKREFFASVRMEKGVIQAVK